MGQAGARGGTAGMLETQDRSAASAARDDLSILRVYIARGVREIVSVPCSITDTWQYLAARAARDGVVRLTMTNHEGNLVGIAAGSYLATGRPALIHMQNSGLTNAADGIVSFASPRVYGIPLAVLVTYRGSTPADDSEPHQEIGERTDALVSAIFGDQASVHGSRCAQDILPGIAASVDAAMAGGIGVVKVPPAAVSRTVRPAVDGPFPACTVERLEAIRARHGAPSMPGALRSSAPFSRDDALRAIDALHPRAAMLYCNGFTSRAARAVCDRPGAFYNVGYMGGTLAMGWSLARSRPDLQVVVVDGDQNALMSTMKDHLFSEYPRNLSWYILNNHIGASVGSAVSVPLAGVYDDLARVVETEPDAPGTFAHPRVRSVGAHTPWPPPASLDGTLAALALRFRQWIEHTTEGKPNGN